MLLSSGVNCETFSTERKKSDAPPKAVPFKVVEVHTNVPAA